MVMPCSSMSAMVRRAASRFSALRRAVALGFAGFRTTAGTALSPQASLSSFAARRSFGCSGTAKAGRVTPRRIIFG